MLHSVSTIRPSEVTLDIKARWRSALARQPSWASPFLTLEFAVSVAKTRKDARIIVARDHQGLLGILAVHMRSGGKARPLGAPVSDHQAFITEAGFDASLEDVLEKTGIGSLSFTSLNDPEMCLGHVIKDSTVSHIADLSAGPDQYFATQRKTYGRHFKKMRQRARGAVRDHGDMKLVLDCRDEADFSLLLDWKREQYRRTRKCDVLAANWISTLLRSLWEEQGRVRAVLNVFYLGGKPAAAEIGLICDGVYHSWIAAYDPERSRCSAGLLLLEGVLQNADKMGVTQVDLGAGHDHYKKYYANSQIVLSQSKVLGQGFAARQYRFIEHYGDKFFAGIPARIFAALDFMATCHPSWQGKVRGIAGRLGQIVA